MTHRETALETLSVVIARLKRAEALGDLERKQIAVACEYAMEAVGNIEELKHARRKAKGGA